jgi:hypothetical protein
MKNKRGSGSVWFFAAAGSDRQLLIQQIPALPMGCGAGAERRQSKRTQVQSAVTDIICETRALPGAVIPAKAEIYSASRWKYIADGLDSRFRGNDQCFERNPIPNDTTTTS